MSWNKLFLKLQRVAQELQTIEIEVITIIKDFRLSEKKSSERVSMETLSLSACEKDPNQI